MNVRRSRRTQRNEVSSDAEVGVFNGEGPPVPIPNTEVKLTSAENTCLATDWKDRSTPTQSLRISPEALSFRIEDNIRRPAPSDDGAGRGSYGGRSV